MTFQAATTDEASHYSLYLVQRDMGRRDARGRPIFSGLVGVVNASPAGYEFIPHTTSHRRSTKLHPTCAKAIPAWANKRAEAKGYGDLLTHAEFVRAQRAAQWVQT